MYAPALGPHAPQRIGDIERRDLLVVLELEELVAAMTGHVDENVRVGVGEQSFRGRCRGRKTTYRGHECCTGGREGNGPERRRRKVSTDTSAPL